MTLTKMNCKTDLFTFRSILVFKLDSFVTFILKGKIGHNNNSFIIQLIKYYAENKKYNKSLEFFYCCL